MLTFGLIGCLIRHSTSNSLVDATPSWETAFCNFKYLRKPLQHVMSTSELVRARSLGLKKALEPSSNLILARVLAITRGLQCSSEQDRFYAILGLPYDMNGKLAEYIAGLEPQYDKSAYQQYFEFENQCIVNGAMEILLSHICHSVDARLEQQRWL